MPVNIFDENVNRIGAWFLGTQGENAKWFSELIQDAIIANKQFRNAYFPKDPHFLSAEVQESKGYLEGLNHLKEEYADLLKKLQKSAPFFSNRNIGHMLWDASIPSLLGYFAAMLYNQNNVATETSPITTLLEIQVGNDMCEMVGYTIAPFHKDFLAHELINEQQVVSWGHITCGGTVSNIEALWMARNLKFYPIAIINAIENEQILTQCKELSVKNLSGDKVYLLDLNQWEAINLPIDEVLALPQKILKEIPSLSIEDYESCIGKYTMQSLGVLAFWNKYLSELKEPPKVITPNTQHYSWPKAASLLGLGSDGLLIVPNSENTRMDITLLERLLQECLEKKVPLLAVVAVIGTTEEGAVDDLAGILKLREKYRKVGLEFTIHADAAWGGYFPSMLRTSKGNAVDKDELPLSNYVFRQYDMLKHADSITIDPHKAGYTPYPAGGLCYRNSIMRNLISFKAPVVYHGGLDPTVGVYGIEGSKPGAAAAAIYLSHKVRVCLNGFVLIFRKMAIGH